MIRSSSPVIAGFAAMLLACLWPTPSSAQVPRPDATPNKAFNNLCMMVGEHMRTNDDSGEYMYRRRILTAADALGDRDPATVRDKVRRVWDWNHPHLYCTNTQFDVPRGNILKFAVSSNFDPFIDDAIAWGIDLNRYDEGTWENAGTVLDYIRFHMRQSRGQSLERKYAGYYRQFREAGALHKRELPGTEAHAALVRANDTLRSALTGAEIDSGFGAMMQRSASRIAGMSDARVTGISRIAAVDTGSKCLATLTLDHDDLVLVAGGRQMPFRDDPTVRTSQEVLSWGWNVQGAVAEGAVVRFALADGRSLSVTTSGPKEASEAAAGAEYLRQHCDASGG